jgi:ectoine hydroxylase-related dioxygenase (phytanoyl-CoA dioxygenase family)
MLKDPILYDALDKLGFCKLQLIDSCALTSLWAIYNEYYKDEKTLTSDMTVTHNNPYTISKSLTVRKLIEEVVEPHVELHFKEFKIFASHFSIKKANSHTSFQLHQDWNVVDEAKYHNCQIWIPLEVSYPENGGMCFLPESHRFYQNHRSGSLGIPNVPIEPALHPFLSYTRLMPCEAAVFHNRTFHGSFINSTTVDRVAVIINIVSRQAPTKYFHYNAEEKSIHVYGLSSDDLFTNLPALERGECPFHFPPIENCPSGSLKNSLITAEDLITIAIRNKHLKGYPSDYEHRLLQILKNDDLEKQINHFGYGVIDLLDSADVLALKKLFNKFMPDRTIFEGAFSSMGAVKCDKWKLIHDSIQTIVKEKLDTYFTNYKVPISLFYTRNADGKRPLDWHSDPSFLLNEHLEPIYGIWCPLTDITPESGGLRIVPGSHRMVPKLNLTHLNATWSLGKYENILNKYSVAPILSAGQALIYDTRMVHSSLPNHSGIDRDNIVMRVTHSGAAFFKVVIGKTFPERIGDVYILPDSAFFDENITQHNKKPTQQKAGQYHEFEFFLTDELVDNKLSQFKTNKSMLFRPARNS